DWLAPSSSQTQGRDASQSSPCLRATTKPLYPNLSSDHPRIRPKNHILTGWCGWIAGRVERDVQAGLIGSVRADQRDHVLDLDLVPVDGERHVLVEIHDDTHRVRVRLFLPEVRVAEAVRY